MPTYVYRCEQGHSFELFHSISDESPKRCPECGAASKRVPAGGVGLLFKGSGFYITDYRSKGYKESAKQEGGGGTDKPAPSSSSTGAPGAPSTPSTPSTPGTSGGASEGRPKPAKPEGGGSSKPEKS